MTRLEQLALNQAKKNAGNDEALSKGLEANQQTQEDVPKPKAKAKAGRTKSKAKPKDTTTAEQADASKQAGSSLPIEGSSLPPITKGTRKRAADAKDPARNMPEASERPQDAMEVEAGPSAGTMQEAPEEPPAKKPRGRGKAKPAPEPAPETEGENPEPKAKAKAKAKGKAKASSKPPGTRSEDQCVIDMCIMTAWG